MRLAAALALLLASHLALAEDPARQDAPAADPPQAAASPAATPPDANAPPAPPASADAPAPLPSAGAVPAAEPAATGTPAPPADAPPRLSRWGVLVDAGLPEGLTVSAVHRPIRSLRLFLGPAWNYVGFGIQGGLSVAPWHFGVTPVLTLEGGRYFGTDLSFLVKGGQGVPSELKPLLRDMSYTYGAVHLGLEVGSQNGFAFTFDLGIAYVILEAKGTVTKNDPGGTVTFSDPRVRATLPSLKLGLHYWF